MNYIVTNEDLTITLDDGKVYTLHTSHINFKQIIMSLLDGDEEAVIEHLDINTSMKKWGKKRVHIEGNKMFFKGKLLDDSLSRRAIKLYEDGKNIKPIELFLEKLNRNPDKRVIEQIYRFLTTNNLPLTWDGDFLAYKFVTKDYKDCHTGKIDNSIGKFVKLNRSECCDDPNQLCAPGLHACSKEYFGSYGDNAKLIIVKISPENVVSIPNEYKDTKLRCCAYYCLQDCPRDIPVDFIYENKTVWEHNQKPVKTSNVVYNQEDLMKDMAKAKKAIAQKRDAKGRFVKQVGPLRDANGRFAKKV
jgi:hypothetical protein